MYNIISWNIDEHTATHAPIIIITGDIPVVYNLSLQKAQIT